jgi:hypothetical protein
MSLHAKKHTFPEIMEVGGLEKREEVLSGIRRDLPFFSKDAAALALDDTVVIDEESLKEALTRAYVAGALGGTVTMQLTMDARDVDVDLTKEIVVAQTQADCNMLPEGAVTYAIDG